MSDPVSQWDVRYDYRTVEMPPDSPPHTRLGKVTHPSFGGGQQLKFQLVVESKFVHLARIAGGI